MTDHRPEIQFRGTVMSEAMAAWTRGCRMHDDRPSVDVFGIDSLALLALREKDSSAGHRVPFIECDSLVRAANGCKDSDAACREDVQ
ncbi:MAG: hypothetical protein EOM91_04020 [Sphingobacteriia bacterium]|nr:hypothetical protein [Sphingobacteriia bacterium]NCC38401.1 hypothetical protein [Gammaproteobacteria bacterium]